MYAHLDFTGDEKLEFVFHLSCTACFLDFATTKPMQHFELTLQKSDILYSSNKSFLQQEWDELFL